MDNRRDLDPGERENIEQQWAKKEFGLLRYRLQGLADDTRAGLQGGMVQTLLQDTLAVATPRGEIRFVLLGGATGGRATHFFTKQPATLAWIDRFAPGSVMWDIGANVGSYALYAASRADIRVVAFEPAAVNYFLLSANVEANALTDRVDCLLVGLGRHRALARIEASQFEAGRSFSFKGKADQPYAARQAALILPADVLIDEFGVPCPNYIKLDTPAMTEDILAGADRTLRRPELREIHVEVRTESRSGQRVVALLESKGFVLSEGVSATGGADATFVRR